MEYTNEEMSFSDDELLPSNKRQRTGSDVNDTLSCYPYIYRCVQAMGYMDNNPLNIAPGLTNEEYVKLVGNYIWNILLTFFSGCGLFHSKSRSNIDQNHFDIFVNTPLNQTDMNLNFSLLYASLEKHVSEAFYKIKCHWETFQCSSEGNWLYFYFRMSDDDDYERDGLWCYTKNLENLEMVDSDAIPV